MKFYKRDPHRALIGMTVLSLKQRGAYNSLLDLLYAQDGDVPDDDRLVARMLSCHWREWKAIKPQLMALGKVWVEGGKLRAKRVQETLKEAADFAQTQSNNASKRWQESKKDKDINEGVMPCGNPSTLTVTPTPTAKEEGRKQESRSLTLALTADEFDLFWSRYPQKTGKKDASKAFEKVRRSGVALERIMAGLERYIATKPADWHWKSPAAWLNGGRYDDQPDINHGVGNGVQKTGNIITAANSLIERIKAFGEQPPTPTVRSGEGADVIRLLPKGGSQ